jgi:plasmid stabilization system protein ParE
MAYRVSITTRAQRDLRDLYDRIDAANSDAALKWYRGLKAAILGLGEHPNRCPVTPESGGHRHLLYVRKPHVYRAVFRVLEKAKTVEVLHIRHGARQPFR